ncbi:MAG: hypothetical protein GX130_07210 [Candidatus Hydrogenedens sp.]|nr:hypothetical protein [Candidatus Hydrogenedens sp.]
MNRLSRIIMIPLGLLCILFLMGCQPKEEDELTGTWTGDWYLQGRVVLRNESIEFQPGKKVKLRTRLLKESGIPVLNRSIFLGRYTINMDEYPHEIDMKIEKLRFFCFPIPIPPVSTAGIFKMDRREEPVTLYMNTGIQGGQRPMPDTLMTEKGPVFVATRTSGKSLIEADQVTDRLLKMLWP